MSKIEYLQVGNKELIRTDLSGMSASQIEEIVIEFKTFVAGKAHNDLVFLTNIYDLTLNKKTMKSFKGLVDQYKERSSVSVFCGSSQMQRIMLNGVAHLSGRTFLFFDSEKEALSYIENVM